MAQDEKSLSKTSSSAEIQAFLTKVASLPASKQSQSKKRLIFALDATASREPAWKQARRIQGEMFDAASSVGTLEIQLCYFRGQNEFQASPWSANDGALRERMASVECIEGLTQIAKVLSHARDETRHTPVQALVFVGDSVEESTDRLYQLAGELGILRVPIFAFQERDEEEVTRVFKQLGKLSGGAHATFDSRSAEQLKALLRAVAIYAAGGREALLRFAESQGSDVLRLARQLGP